MRRHALRRLRCRRRDGAALRWVRSVLVRRSLNLNATAARPKVIDSMLKFRGKPERPSPKVNAEPEQPTFGAKQGPSWMSPPRQGNIGATRCLPTSTSQHEKGQ